MRTPDPGHQRMPRDAGGQLRSNIRRSVVYELLLLGEVPYVDRMHYEEQEPRNQSNPYQKPPDVNWDVLTQRTGRPLYDAHAASCTPLMERFTRFRMSGIL